MRNLTVTLAFIMAALALGFVADTGPKTRDAQTQLAKLEERVDKVETYARVNGQNVDTVRNIVALELGMRMDFFAEVGEWTNR